MALTYEQLTEPERKVWDAITTGALVDLTSGQPDLDIPPKVTLGGTSGRYAHGY